MIDELIKKQIEAEVLLTIPHEEGCDGYDGAECSCKRSKIIENVKAHLRSSMKKVGEEIVKKANFWIERLTKIAEKEHIYHTHDGHFFRGEIKVWKDIRDSLTEKGE